MEEYKKRLISVLPNTDDTLFAVFYYEDDVRGIVQEKVRIRFVAFYEEKWNKDSEWELRNFYLVNYDNQPEGLSLLHDCENFLGVIGGQDEYIDIDKSEYLPIPKKKTKLTTPK